MAERSVKVEGGAPSVSDIFRRALVLRGENPQQSLKDLKARIVREFKGGAFPSLERVTIPEQDSRAPEEDWTAGLSLVRRGIQTGSWEEIANGIVLSLEQTEAYERQRGFAGAVDEWHDRSVGIREPTAKGVGKWMPEELRRLVDSAEKK